MKVADLASCFQYTCHIIYAQFVHVICSFVEAWRIAWVQVWIVHVRSPKCKGKIVFCMLADHIDI